MKPGVLSDEIQVWGFEEGFTLFKDASIGFGLQLSTVDVSCLDDDIINQVLSRIKDFLNGLPSGIDIQFVQDIRPGNDTKIGQHANNSSNDVLVETLTKSRVERLTKLDEEGLLPIQDLKLFVRVPFIQTLTDRPKFFAKRVDYEAISETRLASEIDRARRIRGDLTSSLALLEIKAEPIGPNEVVRLMYSQWNPTRPVDLGSYDPEDIRDSIVFSDVNKSVAGFAIGEMHHRVISLKMPPDQTFASMAQVFQKLPFDSRLFLSVHVPDQNKEIQSLQTQRRMAYAMVYGKKGVSDIENQAKLDDLETLLGQMIASGEKVFHVSLNILLRSVDVQDLEDQVADTLLILRELSGAEGMVESLASFEIFSEIALPNARSKERTRRFKSSNLKDFLPLFAPWSGFERPSILLRTRNGGLYSFDPFAKELINANQIVSGGAGSGKSYLTNLIVNQMLKENPRVFILDIGASYQKSCEILDGQYIPLGSDNPLSINPFDLPDGSTTPTDQKIKFLVGMVELMTKEDSEKRLGRFERAEIEAAIQLVYRNSNSPHLSDLKTILEQSASPEIIRIGKILSPWCGDTPFGKFVDQPTSIELEKKLVCFDLKNLESFPDLQAVCLFLITDLVMREVQRDRSQMKILIFDECWKLLETDSGAVFIAEVFRTFRKYYASCIAISQNIDDFARSKAANAIMPNSSIKWILKQKGADLERLKVALNLNDREVELVNSLRQEKGKFSESFLICEDRRAVVRIESTPFEYWLATTDPRDFALLAHAKKEKPALTKIELLKHLSEKYPNGAMGTVSPIAT